MHACGFGIAVCGSRGIIWFPRRAERGLRLLVHGEEAVSTFLIQLTASMSVVVLLGAYACAANAAHPSPISEIEMLLIFTFAEKNFRSLLGGEGDIEADWFIKSGRKPPTKADEARPYGRVQQFLRLRTELANKGHLGVDDMNVDTSFITSALAAVIVALVTVALAPFYCYSMDYFREEDRNVRAFQVVHSDERGVRLLQGLFLATALAVEAFAVGYFLHGWLRICLLILISPGFCFLLYKFLRLVAWQTKWKTFWSNVFLEGLSEASVKNDHDLCNRTLNMYQTINSAPALPLTGLQKLVVLVFGAAQLAIGLKLSLR